MNLPEPARGPRVKLGGKVAYVGPNVPAEIARIRELYDVMADAYLRQYGREAYKLAKTRNPNYLSDAALTQLLRSTGPSNPLELLGYSDVSALFAAAEANNWWVEQLSADPLELNGVRNMLLDDTNDYGRRRHLLAWIVSADKLQPLAQLLRAKRRGERPPELAIPPVARTGRPQPSEVRFAPEPASSSSSSAASAALALPAPPPQSATAQQPERGAYVPIRFGPRPQSASGGMDVDPRAAIAKSPSPPASYTVEARLAQMLVQSRSTGVPLSLTRESAVSANMEVARVLPGAQSGVVALFNACNAHSWWRSLLLAYYYHHSGGQVASAEHVNAVLDGRVARYTTDHEELEARALLLITPALARAIRFTEQSDGYHQQHLDTYYSPLARGTDRGDMHFLANVTRPAPLPAPYDTWYAEYRREMASIEDGAGLLMHLDRPL